MGGSFCHFILVYFYLIWINLCTFHVFNSCFCSFLLIYFIFSLHFTFLSLIIKLFDWQISYSYYTIYLYNR
jgi:hypothetical protein